MFLPYPVSCKAVSSTDEGLTSQRAWGRRCRRSPVRCGGFDPSLSLRNDRTGLSKIPFVKTYVVCLLLWDILCKSRGWDIPLSSSSRDWLMLAIFSFCGRSGCFSDAAYYTRWLTSPLPSWTTFLLFETTLVSSDLQIHGWCLWTRSSSQVPRAWSFRFLSSRGFLEGLFTVERSDEVVL